MDHLTNFMNSNHYSSLPLFHFLLITNPVTSHIHFPLPILRLITIKRISVLKQSKMVVACMDYNDVLLVFFVIDCCFH
jgi:hypothetical protein